MTSRIVIVTREENPREGPLGAALREAGLEPRHVPLIASRRVPVDPATMDAALFALRSGGWFIFTSRRAVEFWFEAMGERGVDPESSPPTGLVFAVGESTAEAVHARGWKVDYIPDTAQGNRLYQVVSDKIKKASTAPKIVFPRAKTIASDLPKHIKPGSETGNFMIQSSSESMDKTNPIFVSLVVYETVPVEANLESVLADIDAGHVTAITFASPSAVNSFEENLQSLRTGWKEGCLLAAIGPTTAEALREKYLTPAWESPVSNFSGFAAALAKRLAENNTEWLH